MRIDPGELDRRISFFRAGELDDGTATVLGEPIELAKRWAKKSEASDAERMRAAQQGDNLTTRFLVRSDPVTLSITAKDTIRFRGTIYEVTGTKESDERDDAVEITTTSRPDMKG